MSGAFGAVLATSALSVLTVISPDPLTIRGVSERGSLLSDLPRAEAQPYRCAFARRECGQVRPTQMAAWPGQAQL